MLARNRRWLAMWPNTVSDLSGITTISELKWGSPSSGCWEGPTDFSSQNIGNFLRYGNILIVATLESEIMLEIVYHGEFGGASLVHFPCRTSRRIFPGKTFFFPPKKPKMTPGWSIGSPISDYDIVVG